MKKKVFMIGLIIIIIGIFTLNYNGDFKFYNYSDKVISVFRDNDIYNYLKNQKYSKTLEEVINNNSFDINYLNEYLEIVYNDNTNFINTITELLKKGYKARDINNIYKNLDNDKIDELLLLDYTSNLSNYLELPYFRSENLTRYLNYEKNNDFDYQKVVIYVNTNLDYDYYTNVYNIDNEAADSITVLVNKYNKLDSSYVPSDLELLPLTHATSNKYLKKEAKDAFIKMLDDAKLENIYMYAGSTYRSYDYQLNLYNNYVKSEGIKNTDTFAARAGFSEHQTGLAIDVLGRYYTYLDEDDIEYSWMLANSYKYGFILRYPKDKEKITGYNFESWHFRYLGIELATLLHDNNLTYEEYLATN